MRLLISAGLFYPSHVGGPSKTLYWLAKSLAANGVDVSVITTSNSINPGAVEVNKWVSIDNFRVRYCRVKSAFRIPVLLHGIAEMRKCDTVLLSSVFYVPSLFLALFALFSRKKVIWSPRGELFSSALNQRITKIVYLKILKLLFSRKVVFHATSEQESKSIIKYFGAKSYQFILPNYIDLPQIQTRTGDENYLLYVGRIAPIKALDKLLKGILLSESFLKSDFKLKIAGEVENQFTDYYNDLIDFLNLHQRLNEKVIFLGNVSGTQKDKLYAEAYFTLLLSKSENFGNVVIESLCQGTPVIASLGTPWEILNKENAGFWIENDPKEIALAIQQAISLSSNQYNTLRVNSISLAHKFDISRNIAKWIDRI